MCQMRKSRELFILGKKRKKEMSLTEAHRSHLSNYAHSTVKKWAIKTYRESDIQPNKNGYINGVALHTYGYDVTMTFVNWMKRNIVPREK